MSQPTLSSVPLLGALCIAAGLISQADIEECLTLQTTIYPGTPIGQILVLKGYLSQLDLARMVAQQQSFRRTFCATLEDSFAQTGGKAPHAAPIPGPAVRSALPELGTFMAAELDTCPLFGVTG